MFVLGSLCFIYLGLYICVHTQRAMGDWYIILIDLTPKTTALLFMEMTEYNSGMFSLNLRIRRSI